MKLVRVATPKGQSVFQVGVAGVVRADQRLAFMLGWPEGKARAVIRKNGWTATIVAEGAADEAELLERLSGVPVDAGDRERAAMALATRFPQAGSEDPPVEHLCHCGAWGAFGYGVRLLKGEAGQWFCMAHRPDARAA